MTCYKPLTAFQSRDKLTKNGKKAIYFDVQNAGSKFDVVSLPCGRCIGCKLERSRAWALRCVHEASLYADNCFITLTFDDDHLNKKRTLVKRDFQNFMKRLRRSYNGLDVVVSDTGDLRKPIRYFHCGEYGDRFKRPHHHAILFNFDFDDKILWKSAGGQRLYQSSKLDKLWEYQGLCAIGSVTFQSAAYIARYCTKKLDGDLGARNYFTVDEETGEMYYLEPEYGTMSRRPGIGKNWFKEYQSDVYPQDYIVHDGYPQKVPSYYDKIFDQANPDVMADIKSLRNERAKLDPDNTPERLAVRAKVKMAQFERLVRTLE